MSNDCATAFARPASRDAIATTRELALACVAGITFVTPMFAVLRMPQRIGVEWLIEKNLPQKGLGNREQGKKRGRCAAHLAAHEKGRENRSNPPGGDVG